MDSKLGLQRYDEGRPELDGDACFVSRHGER